jgi:hypothetical protein
VICKTDEHPCPPMEGTHMTLVKLAGGPRDGQEVTIDDENHLAVLYPGYTPVAMESSPEGGMVMGAEWHGSDVEAANYEGTLNPTTTESAYAQENEQVVAEQSGADTAAVQPEGEVQAPVQEGATPEGEAAPAETPVTPEAPAQETDSTQVPAGQAPTGTPQE